MRFFEPDGCGYVRQLARVLPKPAWSVPLKWVWLKPQIVLPAYG